MLELISPAGSPEAVIAAVQSGADAIYMPINGFLSRGIPKKLTEAELESSIQYCRIRGCKFYLFLNGFTSETDMDEVLRLARCVYELGADALIVQDIGLARTLRQLLPDIKLHADLKMSIHNLAGAEAAAELGIHRVALSRELNHQQIQYIASRCSMELEVSVHGPLCFCHSGQCYMSALTTGRSVNKNVCAQPCRMQYTLGGRKDNYPLSLKDNCLLNHLDELSQAGITSVRIDGMDMRPEQCAMLTKMYSQAIKEKIMPTADELEQLELIMAGQTFTDAYFTGEENQDMFGIKGELTRDAEKILSEYRKTYTDSEVRRVPITYYALIKAQKPVIIAVEDNIGNRVVVSGPEAETAVIQSLSEQMLEDQLYKTKGTPYSCAAINSEIDDEVFVSPAVLGELRTKLLTQLTEKRKELPSRTSGSLPSSPSSRHQNEPPVINLQFQSPDQLTEDLAALAPKCIYVPISILVENYDKVIPFIKAGSTPVAVLPRIIASGEMNKVRDLLMEAKNLGVNEALISNLGHVHVARLAGFRVRGDFGLNILNAYSLKALEDADFLSAALSFELRLSQIRDIIKPIDTEMLVYGRIPLMVTDHCLIKNSFGRCACQNVHQLSDRRGSLFPVIREFECRNVIYNSQKLYLADKLSEINNIGLWGLRLLFTTESPRECLEVTKSYLGLSTYKPNGLTRGLYYKGAE